MTAFRTGRNLAAHGRRTPRSLLVAGVVCLLSFTAFWAAQRLAQVSMIDLIVYRAEGASVLTGGDLYEIRVTDAHLPATYPPFAALLFTPLALLDTGPVRTLVTAGNLVLLVALAHLSLKLIGRDSPAATLWVAAAAVWCEPVWTTLRYGQINLAVTAAVLWDLTRHDRHRWAGVGIGLAAAVKLTPGLFIVFLFLTGLAGARRSGAYRGDSWLRRAAVAVAAFLAATLVSAALLPHDSRSFWTRKIFESSRVGNTEDTANQSLSGVLARLLHTAEPGVWWVAAAGLVAILGLYAAVSAALRGEGARATLTCAVTALLISPISWSHHWVWCVPLVLCLAAETLRAGGPRRAGAWAAGVAFFSYALWAVPHGSRWRHELHQGIGEFALSAVYPAVGLAFVLTTCAATVRTALSYRTVSTPSDALTGRTAPAQAAQARPEVQALAKE